MTGSFAAGAVSRSAASVPKLHPGEIADAAQIRRLLESLKDRRGVLTRGLNRRIDVESAVIEHIGSASLALSTANFEPDSNDIVFLSFSLNNEPFFFHSRVIRREPGAKLEIEIPRALYQGERRYRERVAPEGERTVALEVDGTRLARDLAVLDTSPEGLAVHVPDQLAQQLNRDTRVSVVLGQPESRLYGVVRNKLPGVRHGWVRIGLEVDRTAAADLRWTVIDDLAPPTRGARLRQSLRIAAGGAQLAFERAVRRFGSAAALPEPQVLDVLDASGRRIRALVDSWGPLKGTTAVVIPPAWGRTKETLMPLAVTMVDCFRSAKQPITVVRFDGINKRGESFRSTDALERGREHREFTFSQGVRDIRTVIDHLHREEGSRPRSTVLVSFSASSIEARRAVYEDPRIDGWICVVGTADLQSMMKAISGGIDYALGLERGVEFGPQEILGVAVDMDLAGRDALENKLAYLEDARRELAGIQVPITWIAGRYDAWMDRDRVKDALSRGDISRRKLVEIPTGHMLKTSRQALGVFQLVSQEVAEIVGRPVARATPNAAELERRRLAELQRLQLPRVDVREFWRDYLLGKDRTVGFELMVLTSAYREFMLRQIQVLNLRDTDRVVDIGSGTGGFPLYLQEVGSRQISVLELDFVREGLKRAQSRLESSRQIWFVEADIGVNTGFAVPVASRSVDCVIASLFLSYVDDPQAVLREFARILRPGGRLVVSSLRRDADMSKLFIEGAAELKERWEGELARWFAGTAFEDAIRGYLNEASRLLDLEETGRFAFWDADELRGVLRAGVFRDVQVYESFGSPPQALIAAAVKAVT